MDGEATRQYSPDFWGEGAEVDVLSAQAVHRRGQELSRHAVTDRGAHGIDVRPGADVARLAVLLHGAEALLGDDEGGLSAATAEVLGRAQVQEHQLSVRAQHQVVGAYIPVDDAAGVDLSQLVDDGKQESDAFAFRQLPL